MGLLPNLRVLATKFQGDIPDLLRFLGLLEKLFLDKHAFLRDYRTSVAELYSGFCQQPCSRSLQRSLSQPQGFVSWPVLLSQCSTVKPKLLPALFGSSLYAGREHKLCVLLKHRGGPAAARAVKSSAQPQRGCAQQKLLKLAGYHLLHHHVVLNITECFKAQASPWWERKGFLQEALPPLALVGLTCQERTKGVVELVSVNHWRLNSSIGISEAWKEFDLLLCPQMYRLILDTEPALAYLLPA